MAFSNTNPLFRLACTEEGGGGVNGQCVEYSISGMNFQHMLRTQTIFLYVLLTASVHSMQHAVAMQLLKKSVQLINRKTTVAADRHDTKDITNYLIWLHCRGHTISEVAGLGMGPFHALPHSEQRVGRWWKTSNAQAG